MKTLNLKHNAFHLLRVSPVSSMSEIEEAYEDAVLEERASAKVLSKAQKCISVPVKRLDSELSCVHELSPEHFDAFIVAVENGEARAKERVESSFSPLSKANIAAHVCSTHRSDSAISDAVQDKWALILLIESQARIEPEEIEHMINKARSSAGGVPRTSRKHICEGLENLRARHRDAALSVICATPHPGKTMTVVMEEYRNRQNSTGDFVRDLVRDYDRWSIPELRKIEEEIDAAIARLNNDPSENAVVDKIVRQLAKWDEYSQPAQLLNETLGLDESRSRALFEKIRAHAIKLANENNKHDLALTLTRAMLHTFPELPDASSLLSEDLDMLNQLIRTWQEPRRHAVPPMFRRKSPTVTTTPTEEKTAVVGERPATANEDPAHKSDRHTALPVSRHDDSGVGSATCRGESGYPKQEAGEMDEDPAHESRQRAVVQGEAHSGEIDDHPADKTSDRWATARRIVNEIDDGPARESSDSNVLSKLVFWGCVVVVLYLWLAG